jgi:2-keto-4-pentenoate hydratase
MSLSSTQASRAAGLLWDAWQAQRPLAALPDDCRPLSRLDGYRIQQAMLDVSGRSVFGWKIAATSNAGQTHIGVDGPLAGRLLDGQIDPAGASVSLQGTQMFVAEVEFAFRMGRDLGPRDQAYSVQEVLDAVDTLHPAIEIPDSRYQDFAHAGAAQLIADNACAHRFMLGAPSDCDWRALDLRAHTVQCHASGQAPMIGKGENVLGDPRVALAWIANELRTSGQVLQSGQVVTTGTCLVPITVKPGDRVDADYGPIGTISIEFVD